MDKLAGSSVSLDKIGFEILMKSLNSENIKINGIYRIMDFIEEFIRCNYHANKYYYEKINYIHIKIKNNFTLDEYASILMEYFNITSQWIHFKNFIHILNDVTVTFDKLGLLILMNRNESNKIKRIIDLDKFIQKRCTLLKIDKNYWEMIKPSSINTYYYLEEEFDYYNIVDEYNWTNLESFISNIKNYKLRNNLTHKLNNEDMFEILLNNMKYGFSYHEFNYNFNAYCINLCEIKYKTDKSKYKFNANMINYCLVGTLNYEEFKINEIDTFEKLNEYLDNCLENLNMAIDLINELYKKLSDKFGSDYINFDIKDLWSLNPLTDDLFNNNKDFYLELEKFFNSDNFKENYPYFYEHFNSIFRYNIHKLKPLKQIAMYFNRNYINKNDNTLNNRVKNMILKLYIYNPKLKTKNVPINSLGNKLVRKNYYCGEINLELAENVIIFVKRVINKFCDLLFNDELSIIIKNKK